MADGTSLPVGMIGGAPREVRPTRSLKLLARSKSSVAFMLCLPLIVIYTFLMHDHIAGLTAGATNG